MGELTLTYIKECKNGIIALLQEEDIETYYPQFYDWFKKVLEINRKVVILKENEDIIGFAILKESVEVGNVKLCTLYIKKEYRNKGYCYKIFDYITGRYNKIHFTVPEEYIDTYRHILRRYNSFLIGVMDGKYRSEKKEYYYEIIKNMD